MCMGAVVRTVGCIISWEPGAGTPWAVCIGHPGTWPLNTVSPNNLTKKYKEIGRAPCGSTHIGEQEQPFI